MVHIHLLGTKTIFTTLHLLLSIQSALSTSFRGIPAAFGDLDLNKRTDIVVIGDDGTRLDIYYQHQRQTPPPLELGSSCKSDKHISQVYLVDIDGDGNPNLLPLLILDPDSKEPRYSLKSLKMRSIDRDSSTQILTTKLTPNTAYSLATAAALNSEGPMSTNSSEGVGAQSLALKSEPPNCEFTDLGVEMRAQPLLFDFEGDLRTDFMSLDDSGKVSVWQPPKHGSKSDHFQKMQSVDWSFISKDYFTSPHSNSFIDINHDGAADIVFSSKSAKIAYLPADPDPSKNFRKFSKEFSDDDSSTYKYGQSSLVDIDADGTIDHILPRCNKLTKRCEIIVLYENGRREPIFKFDNTTGSGDSKNTYSYELEQRTFAKDYEFPITLRASDLDGDGFTDFVVVAKNNKNSKSKVVYLHNIFDTESQKHSSIMGAKEMTRTFEVIEIETPSNVPVHLVTLFDINEDGKIDMLIGAGEHNEKPYDMEVIARMNTQMVDACFMKVLVTNGFVTTELGSNGQSARGPFICFDLSQNDGKKMQGCAGQLSQSSHFALQSPYVIFGLGQTPHFVETLNVSIPGFGTDHRVRTRTLEQIVPDAQVIIIPKEKDNPNSWDFKMFLSPMSDLVFSTLAALAILCIVILLIIFILHRQETLEDAAEHEEYKRHWPESR